MNYIPALVITTNNTDYINSDGSIGAIKNIPTPPILGTLLGDYWAIPVNENAFLGIRYQPYNINNILENVPPTPSAFKVVKVGSLRSADYFYALGTSVDYIAASNSTDGSEVMPTTASFIVHGKATIGSLQNASYNGTNYQFVLPVPVLSSGQKLYAFGSVDGVALTSTPTAGVASASALLTFLNSNWNTSKTSPIFSITWSLSSDNLTLVGILGTGASIVDTFEGGVIAINPSL